MPAQIKYPEIGVCGLSCRLCPAYHTEGISRCGGCKSQARMTVGCPFITCAVKRKGIEFCWQCSENVDSKIAKKRPHFFRIAHHGKIGCKSPGRRPELFT